MNFIQTNETLYLLSLIYKDYFFYLSSYTPNTVTQKQTKIFSVLGMYSFFRNHRKYLESHKYSCQCQSIFFPMSHPKEVKIMSETIRKKCSP